MNNEIKKILSKLEKNGYEGYVVGGYVRDYLLGNPTFDVDICTNALPKEVLNILNIKKESNYGSISFNTKKYNFDITTYRKESDYSNHYPKSVEYVNNLLVDLERRDFTINSICMNKDGKIFDYYGGINDLNNREIRVIGDTKDKLSEDPLRILRALRLSIILDFSLSEEIIEFIESNKECINNISYTRRKQELDKIFISKNINKGLELIKELGLCEILGINYDKVIPTSDILGIWAQMDFSSNYQFNKSSINFIKKVKEIVNSKFINEETLLENDLYVCIVAGEILGLSVKDINKMYNNMPIKNIGEVKINYQDISNLLNIPINDRVKGIHNEIVNKILKKELKNNKRIIKKYIIKNTK